MFSCTLCEKESCYLSKFCDKCRRVKHLLNLYGDDVYNTLETVLVRSKSQQNHKINTVYTKTLQKIQQKEQERLKEKLKLIETPKVEWKANNIEYFCKKNTSPYNLRNKTKISDK
uniref:Uncharacterized protein n=1 Tax=viral metagenome TaxID=1070528 RepID=A0A6C0IVB0_9ZZZZ